MDKWETLFDYGFAGNSRRTKRSVSLLTKFLDVLPIICKAVGLFIIINLLNAVNVAAKLIGN